MPFRSSGCAEAYGARCGPGAGRRAGDPGGRLSVALEKGRAAAFGAAGVGDVDDPGARDVVAGGTSRSSASPPQRPAPRRRRSPAAGTGARPARRGPRRRCRAARRGGGDRGRPGPRHRGCPALMPWPWMRSAVSVMPPGRSARRWRCRRASIPGAVRPGGTSPRPVPSGRTHRPPRCRRPTGARAAVASSAVRATTAAAGRLARGTDC